MKIDDSGAENFFLKKKKNAMLSNVKGPKKFINQSNAYIDGNAIVKKCNFKKNNELTKIIKPLH